MQILDSGNVVGSTPEMKKLADEGRTIRTAFCDFEVAYLPRSTYDPKPWVSHGGDEHGFRYSSRECYAEKAPQPERRPGPA